MIKKIKLRDLTKEQFQIWVDKNCGVHECEKCPFAPVNCSNADYAMWVNHKGLYSGKFLDREIEIEIPDDIFKLEVGNFGKEFRLQQYKEHPYFDTLFKLYEMAKKHNCTINLTTNNTCDNCISEVPQKLKLSEKAEEILTDGVSVENAIREYSSVTFELVDHNTGKPNYLSYKEESISGNISKGTDLEEDIEEELGIEDEEGYFELNSISNEVFGFDGVEKQCSCYREGMIIKYFGDMVCDYLKEPRIIETY